MVNVYEAVTSRRAVRGFTDQSVPREVLERVLSAAAWSPSGSNLQPWNIYVVTGAPLAELKKRAVARVASSVLWDEREYVMYPPAMKSPYRERRSAFGHERYSALGIAHEDWEARQRAAIANWDCFGAPAALFCYIDRDLGVAQWADLGMYLQTVMLLLRAEGLHSCPQMAWSQVRKTVEDIVSPPDELILFCGMSIGYEDVAVEYARTGRAPLEETVTFIQEQLEFSDFPRAGRLAVRLEAAGIDPASVTDVVLTHMHIDHIGGLLGDRLRGQLRPDLRVHLAAAEAEFWESPDFSHTSMPPGVATHLPFPSVCHVAVAGNAFRCVPAVWDY